MKLNSIFSIVEGMKTETKGTYSGVRFSPETKQQLMALATKLKLPNPIEEDKLHTTILYSRKHLPNYKELGKLENPIKFKIKEYEIWDSRGGDRCFVLKLDSPELVKRHKELMDEHQATYDFDEYIPHITLSYDVGDWEDNKEDIQRMLDEMSDDLTITTEYQQDLDLDWSNNNKEKE